MLLPIQRVCRASRGHRKGTAVTEALLVIPPLLVLAFMGVWVADYYFSWQVGRTEAHRDAFDKTHSALLLPGAFIDTYLESAMQDQFGVTDVENRRHLLPPSPPDIPNSWTADFDAPSGLSLEIPLSDSVQAVTGQSEIKIPIFDEGFPNTAVEGWEYTPYVSNIPGAPVTQMMTYSVSIRSPWTWVGWPLLSCQDMLFEPKMIHGWYGGLSFTELSDAKDMKKELKLAD